MITKENAEQIKKQLEQEILKWDVDEESKNKTLNHILSLDEKQLEDFLIKNNLMKNSDNKETQEKDSQTSQDCIFCNIINKKVNSYILDETPESLAVLEINPISKAHLLIIPKQHSTTENIPLSCFNLALEISKIIKLSFNPKDITISTSSNFNHTIINIIPIYGNETNEKKPAEKKELEELQKILSERIYAFKNKNLQKTKELEKKSEKSSEKQVYHMPRRIP
jgi:histidine triad (HIT) family protein